MVLVVVLPCVPATHRPLLLRALAYKVHPYRWATIGLTPEHIAQATPDEVQNEVAIFAMQFRGVSHALSATAMRTSYFGSGYARKMQNSFYPRRSGDVILNLMPGWIEEQERCWSSSGSMYGYDTQVPLVFYGVGVGPQRIKRRMDMTAVAPTVARMLEITEPAASEGEVLPEIIDL